MTRDDLVRFATRDWTAVEESKAAYWVERKRQMSPAEVLELGDSLRRHAASVRPNWPGEADRADDRATHQRVSEALRAAAGARAR